MECRQIVDSVTSDYELSYRLLNHCNLQHGNVLEHIEASTKWSPLTDDIFKCVFLIENVLILLKISLKFVRRVRINNILALVPIMAWHRLCDKPLSDTLLVSLLTQICVTRP